jgi:hypothetical protein
MTASRDPERLIHAFLQEGEEMLQDPIYDEVRAVIEHKRQRTFIGPWRTPIMNRFFAIGLGAAATVVVSLLLSPQLFGNNVGGPGGEPTPKPEATAIPASSVVGPTSTPGVDLAEGPFLAVEASGSLPSITVTIPASGWELDPASAVLGVTGDDPPYDVLWKGEVIDNYPRAGILLQPYRAGTSFVVSDDPCEYIHGGPGRATTVDDFAADLAAQTALSASEPVDVVVDGYAGKSIMLQVPNDVEWENGRFSCWDGIYVSYGTTLNGRPIPIRKHQGPGQIDELWILDVDGSIVILDAMYRPETAPELVEELRAIIESATFE